MLRATGVRNSLPPNGRRRIPFLDQCYPRFLWQSNSGRPWTGVVSDKCVCSPSLLPTAPFIILLLDEPVVTDLWSSQRFPRMLMNTPNLHDRCLNAFPFYETSFSRAGHPNDDLVMSLDECNHSEGHASKHAIFRRDWTF